MSAVVLCAWALGVAAVATVAGLRDPRPVSQVLDDAGVIDPVVEGRIDATLVKLRADLGADVAVVTVDDVKGAPRAFAAALAAHWNLDGVLVLVVERKARLELRTGAGIEARLPPSWLAEMQAKDMLPRFAARDLNGGIQAGIAAIDARMRALHAAEASADAGVDATTAAPVAPEPPTEAPPSGGPEARTGDDGDGISAVDVGVGAAGLGGIAVLLVMRARARRRCKTCGVRMVPLRESADDEYLDAGQRTEERIGSVDYEVLVCPTCKTTRTLRHGRFGSGRARCSSCGYKTLSRDSITVSEPINNSNGVAQVTEHCDHCGFHRVYTSEIVAGPQHRMSDSSDRDTIDS